jgi:hypothetical protein
VRHAVGVNDHTLQPIMTRGEFIVAMKNMHVGLSGVQIDELCRVYVVTRARTHTYTHSHTHTQTHTHTHTHTHILTHSHTHTHTHTHTHSLSHTHNSHAHTIHTACIWRRQLTPHWLRCLPRDNRYEEESDGKGVKRAAVMHDLVSTKRKMDQLVVRKSDRRVALVADIFR